MNKKELIKEQLDHVDNISKELQKIKDQFPDFCFQYIKSPIPFFRIDFDCSNSDLLKICDLHTDASGNKYGVDSCVNVLHKHDVSVYIEKYIFPSDVPLGKEVLIAQNLYVLIIQKAISETL